MSNEALIRAIDLFDLEDYIEQNIRPRRKVASNHEEVQINCISPDGCGGTDTNQHLYVNVEKKKWYCHKCGYGSREQPGTSSLVRFIGDAEGVSYPVVVQRLLKTSVPTPDVDLEEYLNKAFNEEEVEKEISLPGEIVFPKEMPVLGTGIVSRAYREYITGRGFTVEDLSSFGVRYVVKYVFPKTSEKEIKWKWRVVFPVYNLEGQAFSATGRTISKKVKNAWTVWPNSNISDLLWPLGRWNGSTWEPVQIEDTVVLVEGITDAHAVNTLTDFQALCTFGKKISEAQLNVLSRLGVQRVIIAWDKDAKEQIKRVVGRLISRFSVYVFPFASAGWDEFDFGDVLARKMEDFPVAQAALVKELQNPISVDSPEYCSWLLQ